MLQRSDWTYAKMKALKEAHDHTTHQEMFDAPYDTIPYRTKLPGGRLEITIAVGTQRAGDTTTIALSIASTPAGVYDGPDAASQARGHVSAALREGYDKGLADSATWWSRLWARSSISIPDPGLQQHYN